MNPMKPYSKEDAAEIIAHEGGTAYVLASDFEAVTRELGEAKNRFINVALDMSMAHAERDALRAELDVSEKCVGEYMTERNQARDLVRTKNAEIDALRAEVESLRKDAARYRWLRNIARSNRAWDVYGEGAGWSIGFHAADGRWSFDTAVDALTPAEVKHDD
jgi:hypothetical protein